MTQLVNAAYNQEVLNKLLAQKQKIIQQLKSIIMNTKLQQLPQSKISQQKTFFLRTIEHHCFVSIINLPYSVAKIHQYLRKTQNMEKIYPKQMVLSIQFLEKLAQVRIQKHVYYFPWPLIDRQFVIAVMNSLDSRQGIFIWKSCQYRCIQNVNDTRIQGQQYLAGLFIQKINQQLQQCKVTYIIKAKLGFAADMLIRNFLHEHTKFITYLNTLIKNQLVDKIIQPNQIK